MAADFFLESLFWLREIQNRAVGNRLGSDCGRRVSSGWRRCAAGEKTRRRSRNVNKLVTGGIFRGAAIRSITELSVWIGFAVIRV